MHRADVIVIGAGILGTFHAYFAARKGYQTLLIERNAWPGDASTRNFGMIASSITEAGTEWAQFARATRTIYQSLQGTQDITVRSTGSLYLASTTAEDATLQEYAARQRGDERCVYLEATEALARYPFVRRSYCVGALLFPDDLTLDASSMLRRVIASMRESSPVTYVPDTLIVGVEPLGQTYRVTAANGKAFVADRVIVCSGAEYRTLFPERLSRSGLQVCKLQMMKSVPQPGLRLPHALFSGLSIRRYPAFATCPSHGALAANAGDDVTRAYGIHLLFKQDDAGSVIVGDSHEYAAISDVALLEERSKPMIDAAILHHARQILDLPTWEIVERWNGYYLVHPEQPIFTETIDGGIHIVTGIGGKGMTTGPGFAAAHIEAVLG